MDNLNEKEYSMIKNLFFCIKFAIKKQKGFIPILIITGICWGTSPIILSYMSKIVIDISQNNLEVKLLVGSVIGINIIMLILGCINEKFQNSLEWRFLNIKLSYIEIRMKKIFDMDYQNLEDPEILNLMDRARYACDKEHDGMLGMYHNIICFARNILTISVTLGAIVLLNFWIIICVIIFSYISYRILNYYKKINKKRYVDAIAPYWRKINYINSITNDFEYAKDIRIYSMQKFINDKSDEINNKAHRITRQMFERWILSSLGINSVSLVQNIILYSWLIFNVINNGMSIGNFTLYLGLLGNFSSNMIQIFDVIADSKRLSLEISDYRKFVGIKSEINKEKAKKIEKRILEKIDLEFENVYFKYPGHNGYILENFNFRIEPGKKIAIVGGNGEGKTTLIKLLMRLYEPTKGRITLNGRDIREYEKKEYFKIFSVIFQDSQSFALPIKQNISMRKLNETDEKKVLKSICDSGLYKKVEELNQGIETQIHKIFKAEGIELSGGEQQKLALARALYKDAAVMILDEPTAALDAISEDRLYRKFNKIVERKTAIYISHRLASTRFCDEILMIKGGKIIEKGTHKELLNRNGEYKKMYDMQSYYYKTSNLVSKNQ